MSPMSGAHFSVSSARKLEEGDRTNVKGPMRVQGSGPAVGVREGPRVVYVVCCVCCIFPLILFTGTVRVG